VTSPSSVCSWTLPVSGRVCFLQVEQYAEYCGSRRHQLFTTVRDQKCRGWTRTKSHRLFICFSNVSSMSRQCSPIADRYPGFTTNKESGNTTLGYGLAIDPAKASSYKVADVLMPTWVNMQTYAYKSDPAAEPKLGWSGDAARNCVTYCKHDRWAAKSRESERWRGAETSPPSILIRRNGSTAPRSSGMGFVPGQVHHPYASPVQR